MSSGQGDEGAPRGCGGKLSNVSPTGRHTGLKELKGAGEAGLWSTRGDFSVQHKTEEAVGCRDHLGLCSLCLEDSGKPSNAFNWGSKRIQFSFGKDDSGCQVLHGLERANHERRKNN